MKKNIAIVGAGLVGGLLAVYLARRGHRVSLFERRPDVRKMKIVQGRSINLALSDRGWRGLREAGIEDAIRNIALPMKGRLMHSRNGDLTFQPYGREGQAIYSVSRGVLNQTLLHCADEFENVSLHFDARCEHIDLKNAVIDIEQSDGKITRHQFDHVFGTDGAFSAVRSSMMKQDRFTYSQDYLEHGYKELEIPAGENGAHMMRNDCLHIWPREEFMMIALPNLDGSFTCTIFMAFDGKESFSNIKTGDDVQSYFERNFPDAIPLMPTLHADFFENPTSSLVMVKCSPWNVGDKTLLLGDAAHAIVPFYGQGMNCGFEDCRVLNEMLDEYNEDWSQVFPVFAKRRKPAADAILELALRNYIEMRDKTADPRFLLQKKIEGRFSAKHPELWIPLYSQVTFSHTPYDDALRNGDRQQEIMEHIMNMPDIENQWDSDAVEQKILSMLAK